MTTTGRSTLALAALIAAVALGTQSSASASEWGLRVGFGAPYANAVPAREVCLPRPAIARQWIPDYIENRTETVLAAAAHTECVWVPAAYEYRWSRPGMAVRVLRPGYWREVCVPARYETRMVSVLVPGHWEEIAVTCPAEIAVTEYHGTAWRDIRERRR